MMLHLPYNPDLAPSDYYLFRSLQNSLNGKTFNDDEAVKSHLVQFFADKDQKLYERGIMKFLERWKIYHWLKFIACIQKNMFNLYEKIGNYFWDSPI